MTKDRNDILDKVKKLLALANSENEHEASQAASMAQRLLQRYDLCIEDVSEITEEDTQIHEETAAVSGRMSSWRTYLLQGVAYAFQCRTLVYTGYRRTRLVLVGSKGTTTAARETFEYLSSSIDKLTKKNAYGRGKRFTHGYRQGLVMRISERLRAMAKQNEVEVQREATEAGTALVLCKQQALKEYMGQFKGQYKGTSTQTDYCGYNAGFTDGNNVSLNKQLDKDGSGGGYLN